MRTLFLISMLIVGLFCSVSCKQNYGNLIHSVSDFNTPVSCIAPSPCEDSTIVWIGFENGNICRFNFKTDEREIVSTPFNGRIYDIVEEGKDTLWIGVRNQGLVKYIRSTNSIERTYDIVVPRYEPGPTNYTIYDIEMEQNGNLFLGTSSGVYRLNRDERENETLTRIYRPSHHEKYHFGVNQVKIFRDSIYAATDSGLVILDKETPNQDKLPVTGIAFSHLYKLKDVLYASSNFAGHKIIDTVGIPSEFVNIPQNNLFAFIVDTTESIGQWEFTSTQIRYSDTNGQLQPFDLQGRMNPSYKNFLHLGKDFLFFFQGMKIYLLALHQNTKGKSNHIIAAHTIQNGTCYFISNDNYLYSLSKKNETASPLGFIGNFETGENIIKMCSSSEKYLWFITDKQNLYSINLQPSLFKRLNLFQETYEASVDTIVRDDFKSLFYDEKKSALYLGSRYRLYKIHHPEDKSRERRGDTIKIEKRHEKWADDLYVTDIDMNVDDDKLFISSLNHGLFEVRGDSLFEEKSYEEVGSIHSMVSLPNLHLLLFSSCGIFRPEEGLKKSERLTNEKTKFISALFYIAKKRVYVGHHGIGTYNLSPGIKMNDLSNLDMSFNKAAITASGDDKIILLGSQTGLYKYDGKDLKVIPILEKPVFPPKEMAIMGMCLLLLIMVVCIFVPRKEMKNLRKQKDDLLNTIDEARKIISKHIRKEEQDSLFKRVEKIETEIRGIKIGDILKLGSTIIAVKKSGNDLNELTATIQEKQIDRHGVIEDIQQIINVLKSKFKLQDNTSDVESIKKACDSLNELIQLIEKEMKSLKDNLKHSENEKTKEIEKLIQDIEEYKAEKKRLASENKNFTERQSESSKKIKSIIEELKKYKDFLPDSEKEKLETVQEVNHIDSISKSLDELNDLLKNFHANFFQYIHVDDIPLEIRNELKTIFDENEQNLHIKNLTLNTTKAVDEEKAKFNYIKEKSELFFQNNRIYLGKYENWSSTQKAVACLYLLRTKTLPQDVVEDLCEKINNRTASDIRREIYSEISKIPNRNILLEKLYHKTKPTKVKNRE